MLCNTTTLYFNKLFLQFNRITSIKLKRIKKITT